MYVGTSLWVNSVMGTSLYHTYQCTQCPRCEWSLTWMYVGASLWVNSEMEHLSVPHLPVLPWV